MNRCLWLIVMHKKIRRAQFQSKPYISHNAFQMKNVRHMQKTHRVVDALSNEGETT